MHELNQVSSVDYKACCIGRNMVFSDYTKQRIVYHYHRGLKPPIISSCLSEEGITASRVGIHKFLKNYIASGCIAAVQVVKEVQK